MRKKLKIKERIAIALSEKPIRRINYIDLARKVFPYDDYPRAWRHSVNGGPPGCYMALSRALNEMGIRPIYDKDGHGKHFYTGRQL